MRSGLCKGAPEPKRFAESTEYSYVDPRHGAGRAINMGVLGDARYYSDNSSVLPVLDQRRRTLSHRKAYVIVCDETDLNITSSGQDRSKVARTMCHLAGIAASRPSGPCPKPSLPFMDPPLCPSCPTPHQPVSHPPCPTTEHSRLDPSRHHTDQHAPEASITRLAA